MKPNYDPFEKHRELIEYLMIGHMSSFSVNGHLASILGSSEVLLKEVAGALNEDQKHFLRIINNNTRALHQHINTFITTSRLIFKPQQLYLTNFSVAESVDRFIESITRNTQIQIRKDIPETLKEVEGDANLIDYAFSSIESIIKQIHPEGKGDVQITIRNDSDLLKFFVSTNQEKSVDLGEENLEVFIVRSVMDLHGSEFRIVYDRDRCNMRFTLPIRK